MKKITAILTITTVIWFSCTKATFVPTEVDCEEVIVTYDDQIRDIIDTKCASSECHDGTPTVPGDYRSYEGMRSAFGNDLISRRVIDDQFSALSMPPPDSDTLTSEEFVLLNCWIEQEFPEN